MVFAVSATVATGALIGAGLVGLTPAPRAAAVDTSVTEVASSTVDSSIVKAADLSQFRPGNIISDAVFFNSATMSEAQIQSFLESKVSSCRSGYTCLKDYYVQTRAIAADAMCGAYSGGGTERASRVIYKVARACGINPQVLLVMLQKEQGLVTSTAPSAWAYQAAMGQGCPDTAACDSRYYGLFNQVYGGAWQMKRYANPPGTSKFFTWYAPGKTWNILYHPNSACGRGAIYVENQATANLYYYTPYQPNAAALAAGYSIGDGCSSYGNRNFFNYFTDWFGSTQTVAPIVSVGYDIYIVSGGNRYHITAADWPVYKATFGAPVAVNADYISSFQDQGDASRFVRNRSNGTVSYLDSSATHRFPSCTLVSAWGGSCSSLTQLAAEEFDLARAGGEMTRLARLSGDDRTFYIDGSTLAPVLDQGTAKILNGGSTPFVGLMPKSVADSYTIGALRFAPGQFITLAGSTEVYLPTTDGRLLYLPSWSIATELGLEIAVYRTVKPAVVADFSVGPDLSLFVSCAGTSYFAADRLLRATLSDTGFEPVSLDSPICRRLEVSGATGGEVFVKTAASDAVYHATGGMLKHVATLGQLNSLAGSNPLRIRVVSAAAFAALPIGSPYLIAGELVKAPSSDTVYLADGDTLLDIPSLQLLQAAGLGPSIRIIPTLKAGAVDKLQATISCDGAAYEARGGGWVATGATVTSSTQVLTAETCRALKLKG